MAFPDEAALVDVARMKGAMIAESEGRGFKARTEKSEEQDEHHGHRRTESEHHKRQRETPARNARSLRPTSHNRSR